MVLGKPALPSAAAVSNRRAVAGGFLRIDEPRDKAYGDSCQRRE